MRTAVAGVVMLLSSVGALAQPQPVTVDNFTRAETDLYFGGMVKQGGLGTFFHHRQPPSVDAQSVVRLNRDTLYSSAVIDLDAGPVSVTLPDAGQRFMSLFTIDQDHYVGGVFYKPGTYTFSKDKVGTRYFLLGVRTFVDPANPKDLEQVHALQDALKIEQANVGSFSITQWDPASQKKVRDALLTLQSTLPDFKNAFGARRDVDPIRHLLGTAAGWGGNPDKDAIYLNVTLPKNDGTTVYRLTVPKDVPIDGFWSLTVYNAEGYFEKNPYDAYAFNNVTAKKNADGSVSLQFGGCDGKVANCLPIMKGWNYLVRLYRPREEVLKGQWSFPTPQAGN